MDRKSQPLSSEEKQKVFLFTEKNIRNDPILVIVVNDAYARLQSTVVKTRAQTRVSADRRCTLGSKDGYKRNEYLIQTKYTSKYQLKPYDDSMMNMMTMNNWLQSNDDAEQLVKQMEKMLMKHKSGSSSRMFHLLDHPLSISLKDLNDFQLIKALSDIVPLRSIRFAEHYQKGSESFSDRYMDFINNVNVNMVKEQQRVKQQNSHADSSKEWKYLQTDIDQAAQQIMIQAENCHKEYLRVYPDSSVPLKSYLQRNDTCLSMKEWESKWDELNEKSKKWKEQKVYGNELEYYFEHLGKAVVAVLKMWNSDLPSAITDHFNSTSSQVPMIVHSNHVKFQVNNKPITTHVELRINQITEYSVSPSPAWYNQVLVDLIRTWPQKQSAQYFGPNGVLSQRVDGFLIAKDVSLKLTFDSKASLQAFLSRVTWSRAQKLIEYGPFVFNRVEIKAHELLLSGPDRIQMMGLTSVSM